MAGAQTPRRLPNWFRIALVATTRLEPGGSLDAGHSGIRSEDGKPLLARSPHPRASHATKAAGLAWCSIQLMARALAAASGANWLIRAWLRVGRSSDGPRWERMSASPPAPATSRMKANSAAGRQRRDLRPFSRRLHRSLDAGPPPIRPSSLPARGWGGGVGARPAGGGFPSVSRADAIDGIGPTSRAPAATSSLSAVRADG